MIMWMLLALLHQEPGPAGKGDGPPAEDPAVLRQRIDRAMKAAEEQLRQKKPGDPAQQQQRQAVEDLEKLMRAMRSPPQGSPPPSETPSNPAQRPPTNTPPNAEPPSTGRPMTGGSRTGQAPPAGAPPQAGGGSAGRDKPSGENSPGARPQPGGKTRERRGGPPRPMGNREAGDNPGRASTPPSAPPARPAPPGDRPGDAPGQPGANPDQARGATMPRVADAAPSRLADFDRDVWGHLPDALRQEVDQYYRERFMPRYQELIRQYYSRLAEADRAAGRKKP
jgi:hypothetical protein